MAAVFEIAKLIFLHFFKQWISEFQGDISKNYCILCFMSLQLLFWKKLAPYLQTEQILFEIKGANKPFL